jgi:hypothetical protein
MRKLYNECRSSISRNRASETDKEASTSEHFNMGGTTLNTNTNKNDKGTNLKVVVI